MNYRRFVEIICALNIMVLSPTTNAEEKLILRSKAAQVSVAVAGGAIVEFRFLELPLNPLNWEIGEELEPMREGTPRLRGHFLCLDRWGPPSAAEEQNGVPFHGEAARVVWQIVQQPEPHSDGEVARMHCTLPLAGLRVRRAMTLDSQSAVLTVTEAVTNLNKLGRIYNIVQHPSIAPPFLDESTLVDSNATHGFDQDGAVPRSRETASDWPEVSIQGRRVNLRRLFNSAPSEPQVTRHDVTSFVFDDSQDYGWVTACNPKQKLLLGYVWKSSDYSWLNIWRYLRNGRVSARGLEFGTTGYHQPFPVLVRTGHILEQPTYEYIDADQTISKSYAAFLLKIPEDYLGVANISYSAGRLRLTELREQDPRSMTLGIGNVFEE